MAKKQRYAPSPEDVLGKRTKRKPDLPPRYDIQLGDTTPIGANPLNQLAQVLEPFSQNLAAFGRATNKARVEATDAHFEGLSKITDQADLNGKLKYWEYIKQNSSAGMSSNPYVWAKGMGDQGLRKANRDLSEATSDPEYVKTIDQLIKVSNDPKKDLEDYIHGLRPKERDVDHKQLGIFFNKTYGATWVKGVDELVSQALKYKQNQQIAQSRDDFLASGRQLMVKAVKEYAKTGKWGESFDMTRDHFSRGFLTYIGDGVNFQDNVWEKGLKTSLDLLALDPAMEPHLGPAFDKILSMTRDIYKLNEDGKAEATGTKVSLLPNKKVAIDTFREKMYDAVEGNHAKHLSASRATEQEIIKDIYVHVFQNWEGYKAGPLGKELDLGEPSDLLNHAKRTEMVKRLMKDPEFLPNVEKLHGDALQKMTSFAQQAQDMYLQALSQRGTNLAGAKKTSAIMYADTLKGQFPDIDEYLGPKIYQHIQDALSDPNIGLQDVNNVITLEGVMGWWTERNPDMEFPGLSLDVNLRNMVLQQAESRASGVAQKTMALIKQSRYDVSQSSKQHKIQYIQDLEQILNEEWDGNEQTRSNVNALIATLSNDLKVQPFQDKINTSYDDVWGRASREVGGDLFSEIYQLWDIDPAHAPASSNIWQYEKEGEGSVKITELEPRDVARVAIAASIGESIKRDVEAYQIQLREQFYDSVPEEQRSGANEQQLLNSINDSTVQYIKNQWQKKYWGLFTGMRDLNQTGSTQDEVNLDNNVASYLTERAPLVADMTRMTSRIGRSRGNIEGEGANVMHPVEADTLQGYSKLGEGREVGLPGWQIDYDVEARMNPAQFFTGKVGDGHWNNTQTLKEKAQKNLSRMKFHIWDNINAIASAKGAPVQPGEGTEEGTERTQGDLNRLETKQRHLDRSYSTQYLVSTPQSWKDIIPEEGQPPRHIEVKIQGGSTVVDPSKEGAVFPGRGITFGDEHVIKVPLNELDMETMPIMNWEELQEITRLDYAFRKKISERRAKLDGADDVDPVGVEPPPLLKRWYSLLKGMYGVDPAALDPDHLNAQLFARKRTGLENLLMSSFPEQIPLHQWTKIKDQTWDNFVESPTAVYQQVIRTTSDQTWVGGLRKHNDLMIGDSPPNTTEGINGPDALKMYGTLTGGAVSDSTWGWSQYDEMPMTRRGFQPIGMTPERDLRVIAQELALVTSGQGKDGGIFSGRMMHPPKEAGDPDDLNYSQFREGKGSAWIDRINTKAERFLEMLESDTKSPQLASAINKLIHFSGLSRNHRPVRGYGAGMRSSRNPLPSEGGGRVGLYSNGLYDNPFGITMYYIPDRIPQLDEMKPNDITNPVKNAK